jgi:hypothetical protein
MAGRLRIPNALAVALLGSATSIAVSVVGCDAPQAKVPSDPSAIVPDAIVDGDVDDALDGMLADAAIDARPDAPPDARPDARPDAPPDARPIDAVRSTHL